MELFNKKNKKVPMSTKNFIELLELIVDNHPEVNDYPIFCHGHPIVWAYSATVDEIKDRFDVKNSVNIVADPESIYTDLFSSIYAFSSVDKKF